jgi:hypothetical protein
MEITTTVNNLLLAEQELAELLKQDIDYPQKLPLLDLEDVLTESLKNFNKVREDLLKEHGKPSEDGSGTITIEIFQDKEKTKVTDEYKAYQDGLNKLVVQEKSITFTPVPLSTMSGLKTKGKALRIFLAK